MKIDDKIKNQLDRAQHTAPSTGPAMQRQATPMDLAMEAAREYARETTSAVRQRELLDSIRGLLGGRIGQPVPRPVAEAMGLSAAEINDWPADL
jgi:hypothetical protein